MNELVYVTVVRYGKRTITKNYGLRTGDPEFAELDAEDTANFRRYVRYLGKQGFVLRTINVMSYYNYDGNHVTDYTVSMVPSYKNPYVNIRRYCPGYQETSRMASMIWSEKQCGFGMVHGTRGI